MFEAQTRFLRARPLSCLLGLVLAGWTGQGFASHLVATNYVGTDGARDWLAVAADQANLRAVIARRYGVRDLLLQGQEYCFGGGPSEPFLTCVASYQLSRVRLVKGGLDSVEEVVDGNYVYRHEYDPGHGYPPVSVVGPETARRAIAAFLDHLN